MKYIVIIEIRYTGHMECIGIFDNKELAYGTAYLNLVDDAKGNERYFVSTPELREGEQGYIMWTARKDNPDLIRTTATILEYEEAEHEQV